MRLSRIRVKKLFGVFDHDIPLRLQDRITIIYGLNGYGKTTILLLLRAFLTGQLAKARKIPFESFHLSFDDGKELSVTRHLEPPAGAAGDNPPLRAILIVRMGGIPFTYDPTLRREDIAFPLEMIEQHIPDLGRISPDRWVHIPTGRQLELEEVIDLYPEYLPVRRRPHTIPEWYTNFASNWNVRLIEAQRLLSLSAQNPRRPQNQRGLEPAVSMDSRELAARIQQVQAEYGTFSQQLDSTFPTRAIQAAEGVALNADDLKTKLQSLDEKRRRIIDAGLLTKDQSQTPFFDPSRDIDAKTTSILSLYSSDVEKKLGILDPLTEKIELFTELVNKRFSYKKLAIQSPAGFAFSTQAGRPLAPADLSSGEQHEMVLLYEFLFNTNPNSLILIDEPELSLHVGWQMQFLTDLARVLKISPFDAVIATHSPQIINERWDLTQELKGPGDA